MTTGNATAARPSIAGRWSRALLRRAGVDMHVGEGLPSTLLFGSFFLLIAFFYAARTVRQSTFISELGYAKLPWVYLLVALSSYPFLRLYGRFADRWPHRRLTVATMVVVAASMALFWWLYQVGGAWVPVAFYMWLSIAIVLAVSQFWTYANHVLTARQAKRLFGFIGAGGLLGSIAGGQVARVATSLVGTHYSLLVASGMLLMSAGVLVIIERLVPHKETAEARNQGLEKLERAKGGFEALSASRHLRLIAALMLLTVMVAQVVDLQFNWAVENMTTDLDQRTEFFGNFFSIMGVSAFLFQLLFTSRIHRTLGVGFAMRVLPVTMGVGTILLLGAASALPALLASAALVLKIGENGIRYSLDQATRELLFMPVPTALRAKAKAFIDVFVQRSAKGLAALLLLPVSFGLIDPVQAGVMSLTLIALWLLVTVALRHEYVRSFRLSLRRREIDADLPINLSDPETLEVLVSALGSADSRHVLHSLEILESHDKAHLAPPLLVYHDEPDVRLRMLEIFRLTSRRDAAHLVERRLTDSDPEVRAAAIEVLADLHGQAASSLMVPKIGDPDPGVRAAAVACLASSDEESHRRLASSVLAGMLSDAEPQSRIEAAKALGAIPEPALQEQLVRLLSDPDPSVVRGAIGSMRRRAARDGFNPLYGPSLVALLSHRFLKHEARTAIVALGDSMVPTLRHFMASDDEQLWVRRAIPKTLADLRVESAVEALVEALPMTTDAFLRAKITEALAGLSDELRATVDSNVVEREIAREVDGLLTHLAQLHALGLESSGTLLGDRVTWNAEAAPTLLERLLGERITHHVDTTFRLIGCLGDTDAIREARWSFGTGERDRRANVIEFLDNHLSGDVRRHVLVAVDERPLAAKIEAARQWISDLPTSPTDVVRSLLESDDEHLCVAALDHVRTHDLVAAYSLADAAIGTNRSEFVRETATWISQRRSTNHQSEACS